VALGKKRKLKHGNKINCKQPKITHQNGVLALNTFELRWNL